MTPKSYAISYKSKKVKNYKYVCLFFADYSFHFAWKVLIET